MNAKTFGERIRELRKKSDFSLMELDKKVGNKSAAFLSDVELGWRYPSEELLADIARVLHTTVKDLKSYDTRAPVEEIKRLAAMGLKRYTAYGIAFRTALRFWGTEAGRRRR